LSDSKSFFGSEQQSLAGDIQSFTLARTNWWREGRKGQLEPQGVARAATTIPIGMKRSMKFCQSHVRFSAKPTRLVTHCAVLGNLIIEISEEDY
jgi:hypothetical protein